MKTLLNNSPTFQRYSQEKPGYAPFVMGVEFAGIGNSSIADNILRVKPPVTLTISSGDLQLFTEICNRSIEKKDQLHILGMQLRAVNLLPPTSVSSNQVTFTTTGHMVLKGADGYLSNPQDISSIQEAINYHMLTKAEFLRTNWNLSIPVLEPVEVLDASGLRAGVCFHYSGMLSTLRGRFALGGEPATLQFLHDYGVGSRTGQGFGLVKVVRPIG